jgi:hypothetical protein
VLETHGIKSSPLASRSNARYAHVFFAFTTTRASWHTVVNVVIPLFLLTSSTFVVVPVASIDSRLQVLGMLLTAAIAMRFVSMSLMPRISYTTSLDGYVLGCLVFIIVAGIESSLRTYAEALSNQVVDAPFFTALASVWGLFNIYYARKLLPASADLCRRRVRPCEMCQDEDNNKAEENLKPPIDDKNVADKFAYEDKVDQLYSDHENQDRSNFVCFCDSTGNYSRFVSIWTGRTLCAKHYQEEERKLRAHRAASALTNVKVAAAAAAAARHA